MPALPQATPQDRPQGSLPVGPSAAQRGSQPAPVKDWQAAIGVTVLLFLAGETEAAPLAMAIAWGAALGYIFITMERGGRFPFSGLIGGNTNGRT